MKINFRISQLNFFEIISIFLEPKAQIKLISFTLTVSVLLYQLN